jgi:8-oxo-dGTP diphosphatase/2-hydroxy-dATP diphosphatase
MARIPQTVSVIQKGGKILLGMKKRGFGAGRWNGFGGKLKEGETVVDGARRELKEEAGIDVDNLEEMGVIDFQFLGEPDILEVHFLKAEEYQGEPIESEEMKPQWFSVDEIPYDTMWPDDKYWLPMFLEDKKFGGHIKFGKNQEILENGIKELQGGEDGEKSEAKKS